MDTTKLLFIGVPILIAAVIIVGFVRRRAQRKKLEKFATSRGWSYTKFDNDLVMAYPDLFPFGQGLGKRCENIVSFTAGQYPAQSFDYTYTESGNGDDDNDTTYRYHVVGIELPLPLPQVTIRPKSRMGRVESGLTSPIVFELAEFNNAWFVRSEHPPAAHDLIHPRMMEWFLQGARRANVSLEDHRVFTSTKGRQKPENIDTMIATLMQFTEQIPGYVWQKAQGEYPRPQRFHSTQNLSLFLRQAKEGHQGGVQ